MSLHSSLTRMLCTLLLPTPILAWQPVDLYPREAIDEISKPEAIQRGCVLLEQVLQKSFANQQPATTDRAAVLHIDLRDDWHGVTSEHIPPWPPTNQRLQLRFSPHSIHGEIEFANGPLANEIWGVEGKRQGSWGYDVWQSFTRDASGAKTSGEEQEKAFIINAYRTMSCYTCITSALHTGSTWNTIAGWRPTNNAICQRAIQQSMRSYLAAPCRGSIHVIY